jgi:hypothetical protein
MGCQNVAGTQATLHALVPVNTIPHRHAGQIIWFLTNCLDLKWLSHLTKKSTSKPRRRLAALQSATEPYNTPSST